MVRVTCPAWDVHLCICAFVHVHLCMCICAFVHLYTLRLAFCVLLSALALCTLRLLVFSVKNTKIFEKF